MQGSNTAQPFPNNANVSWVNRPSDAELCMRTCGCFRGGGYPGGPGFTQSVTVSGQVISQAGAPAVNLTMESTVNGRLSTSATDRLGRYAVTALRGSGVSVAPRLPLGVTANPPRYNFINLQNDAPNRNFALRGIPIMPF